MRVSSRFHATYINIPSGKLSDEWVYDSTYNHVEARYKIAFSSSGYGLHKKGSTFDNGISPFQPQY